MAPNAPTYTMLGLVGWTTMRPTVCVFSSPISFHVRPPSVDLYTPPPGDTELREFCSPVPAHTCMVSLGAMASDPMEMTRWLSKTGRKVVPLLVVFHMPPAADATKNVLEGDGMAAKSEIRPIVLAGPTSRHRKAARVVVSTSNGVAACACRCDVGVRGARHQSVAALPSVA